MKKPTKRENNDLSVADNGSMPVDPVGGRWDDEKDGCDTIGMQARKTKNNQNN